MPIRINLAAVILMLTPAIAFCTAVNPSKDPARLVDTSWNLSTLPGYSLLPDRPVTMHFDAGEVQGSDGCNRYRAPYTIDVGSFQLSGNIVSTKMACPEPVMKQAAAFIGAFAKARAVRIDSGQLVLLDADGLVLATLTSQVRELPGTSWQATGYNNGKQAVASVRAGSTLTVEFGPDGRIGGSAGCNSYTGAYSVSGQNIRIGTIATTKKMCALPQGVMEQEAAFLRALEQASIMRMDGDRIELRSHEGSLLVVATRTAAAPGSPIPGRRKNAPASGAERSAESVIGAHGLRLPATFRGDLPCADCETVRHHLDVWPDQVFHLRRQWVGRDLVRDEVGRWRVDPTRKAFVLHGGGEMPLQYEIKGPDRLRQLDTEGKPIQSDLPYELVSDDKFTPTDLSLLLAGEMQYLADAARFTECLTGRSYPIVMEGDFREMERAYRHAASEAGAPLYVTFEGSIVQRPRMDGDGLGPRVVVGRFINAWPHEKCERAMANASMTNTYWRIVRLGGDPVTATEGRREPHLLLRGERGRSRYVATVGCNQLMGSYAIDGDAINVKPAAATLMACPPPLATLEKKLGDVLAKARRWRIKANTLEFLDEKGGSVALFEAVYL